MTRTLDSWAVFAMRVQGRTWKEISTHYERSPGSCRRAFRKTGCLDTSNVGPQLLRGFIEPMRKQQDKIDAQLRMIDAVIHETVASEQEFQLLEDMVKGS